MRRYIFILTILMQALIIDAQNDNSIRQLIQYLERNHRKELTYRLMRMNNNIAEAWGWEKEYDNSQDKPTDRYNLQLLKDTIMQYFIDASADAVACYHQQTTNGTEDSIRYALAFSEDSHLSTDLNGNKGNFYYQGKEAALFYYYPNRKNNRVYVSYYNNTQQMSCGKVLDYKPIKPMIARIVSAAGGEEHPVSYRYNTQKDKLNYMTLVLWSDSTGRDVPWGDKVNVVEGACSGTLYIIPQEKSAATAITLHQELYNYLQGNLDKEFVYFYNYPRGKNFRLHTWKWDDELEYSSADAPHEHVYGMTDRFGRYTILFVDHVDSTFALPDEYETMLSYDHGKIEHVPDYEKLQQTPSTGVSGRSLLGKVKHDFGPPIRQEWIGGKTFRQITAYQSDISKQAINNIRNEFASSPLGNMQHKESHTAEGDTLELTAEEDVSQWQLFHLHLLCRFYGKGDTQTAYMQIITDEPHTASHVAPFDTRWVDKFVDQMKDSACIEEHKVHYEYGKKLEPESMGKVDGKLYVLTAPDNLQKGNILLGNALAYAFSNKNQSFHIVKEPYIIRFTDRIIAWSDKKTNQFRLLCIDKVEGKYLIPEEWYNIISYRYGKKKYLNKRK